jgi:hypothetical protein
VSLEAQRCRHCAVAIPEVRVSGTTVSPRQCARKTCRCGGALSVPELDVAAGIDSAKTRIRERVFEEFEDSPAGHIAKFAGLLAPVAPGLAVSPDALDHCGVRPTNAEWSRFLSACDLVRSVDAESA